MAYQGSKKIFFGYLMQREEIFPNEGYVYGVKEPILCQKLKDESGEYYLILTGKYKNKITPAIEDMKADEHYGFFWQPMEYLENFIVSRKNGDFDFIRKEMLAKFKSCFYWHTSEGHMERINDERVEKAILDSKLFHQEEYENNNLDSYGEFLDRKDYLVDPAVGREEELHQLIIALLSQEKSALLVGPPGVGKTAIVEGLAYRLQKDDIPKKLADYKILKVNVANLVSGTCYRGDFEKKVENLFADLAGNPNVLLFIDELHTVIGAGSSSSSGLDFANMLKPYLDRGQVKVIGATTEDEYDYYIDSDPALKRRFKKIDVEEPNEDTLRVIFDSVMNKLSQKTNLSVSFDDEEKDLLYTYLLKVTEKARRVYDDMLFNPDLALSIMDTAFACALASNQETIEVGNFAEAMRLENRIYPSTREILANELLGEYDALQQERMLGPSIVLEEPKRKIIMFDQLN